MNQAAVAKGQSYDDVGLRDASSAHVDETQDESGQSKGAETQGGGVGELATLDGLVGTGLELTPECRQAAALRGIDLGKRTVPETSSAFGGLVLFMAHVAGENIRAGGGAIGVVVKGVAICAGTGVLVFLVRVIVSLGRAEI